jgi:hypothetical protein
VEVGLDISIIHGDGTTTAAKKGGDNIGFNGHKKIKGDKVVAFCDRNCHVIAPFISAPGNQNESPLLRDALPEVTRIASSIGLDLRGTIVSLDGVYDCPRNRKAIFNRGMVPNINPNARNRQSTKRGRKPFFDTAIFKERFNTIERCVWLGGQIPPPAAPVRTPQRVALRLQVIGLRDDQSTPLLLTSAILALRL